MLHKQRRSGGFTLIELSIVLMIVGLLLVGMINGTRIILSRAGINEAERDVSLALDAILGFAIINGRLPCPDTDGFPPGGAGTPDGFENRDGGGGCISPIGYLPYSDLGVNGIDPWGNFYFYRVAPIFADAPPVGNAVTFTLNDLGNITVLNGAGGQTIANSIPALVFSIGQNQNVVPSVDENENTDGNLSFVSRNYEGPAGVVPFDDIIGWLSPNVLMLKMVDAGQLPE